MAANILLIDDDADVREMVRAILRAKGYLVHETSNGRIGLGMIEDVNPDLIIVDLMLPGMSGLEILKAVRADDRFAHIPVIVLSGAGDSQQKPNEYWRQGLGVDEFISKGTFSAEELLGHVAYLLKRSDYRSAQPSRPAPSEKPQEAVKETPASDVDLSAASSSDVVRYFLEAWNTQNFGLEYDCMGGKMTPPIGREDFIQRRMARAEEPGERDRRQYVKEILDVQDDGVTATVKIRREDEMKGRVTSRVEVYLLQKSASGWKIILVKIPNIQ